MNVVTKSNRRSNLLLLLGGSMMNAVARCMRMNINCHKSSQKFNQTLSLTDAYLTKAPHLAMLAVDKAATTPMHYSYSWSPQTPTLLASETPYYNNKCDRLELPEGKPALQNLSLLQLASDTL